MRAPIGAVKPLKAAVCFGLRLPEGSFGGLPALKVHSWTLAWRRRLSSDLVMSDGQNSQDNGSQHEHEAQGDPEPVDDSPDGKNTLTEALTSRAHTTFSIGRTTVGSVLRGRLAPTPVRSSPLLWVHSRMPA
jgi:hypothetical protein